MMIGAGMVEIAYENMRHDMRHVTGHVHVHAMTWLECEIHERVAMAAAPSSVTISVVVSPVLVDRVMQ